MKTLKYKWLTATSALALTLGLFLFVNASPQLSAPETSTTTQWRYVSDSTDETEFSKAENYELGSGNLCGITGNKPCQITVPATDEQQLENYLSGMTNQEVLDIADSRRN